MKGSQPKDLERQWIRKLLKLENSAETTNPCPECRGHAYRAIFSAPGGWGCERCDVCCKFASDLEASDAFKLDLLRGYAYAIEQAVAILWP